MISMIYRKILIIIILIIFFFSSKSLILLIYLDNLENPENKDYNTRGCTRMSVRAYTRA